MNDKISDEIIYPIANNISNKIRYLVSNKLHSEIRCPWK